MVLTTLSASNPDHHDHVRLRVGLADDVDLAAQERAPVRERE
jgi:hypothetical protein